MWRLRDTAEVYETLVKENLIDSEEAKATYIAWDAAYEEFKVQRVKVMERLT